MHELAVWRPDAFVDPDEYVAHVDRGLRALRRTARDDVRLTMTVDEERSLIDLVCVRTPDDPVPALVASLSAPVADTAPDEPVEPPFPAAPSAERLAVLGWDHVSLGPVHGWALGPVAGFDPGLRSLSTRVVDTLREFACPLGFVDLRLQQLGTPTGGPDQ
jgi:hypothetical protein